MTTTKRAALKTVMAALALWLAAVSAHGQNRIEKQVKDLEGRNVMTDKIVKRDPNTKRVGMETKSFHFYSQGGTVANALREAFEADAGSATNIERGQRGDNYECVLTFVQGTTKTVYRLSISGDKDHPEVDLQTYYRDESVNIDESSVESTHNHISPMTAATGSSGAAGMRHGIEHCHNRFS